MPLRLAPTIRSVWALLNCSAFAIPRPVASASLRLRDHRHSSRDRRLSSPATATWRTPCCGENHRSP